MAGRSRSSLDIGLSADDRVSGTGRRRGKAKPVKGKKAKPTRGGGSGRRRERPIRDKKPFSLFGFLFYWAFVLGLWGAIIVGGIVAWYGMQLPSADSWAVPERPANIRIVAADGRLISNRGQMGGEAVSIRDLPYYVPEAVMAIEDKRFYNHFGVDPIGLAAAMVDNITAGEIRRGGSTLTQQLAKNLFLTPDQTLGRKVQEALLALWLEQTYTKDEIIELYLNRVYFGAGAYGIEAAAQRYFGKSARNLSLGEAAIMAGVLQAPSRLSPDKNPDGAAARGRIVLNEMAAQGFISPEEAQAAAIDPNRRIRTRVIGAEYYVADWVEALMTSYIGTVEEDVIVQTTIDWEWQKQAEFAVREVIDANGEERGFTQGALVSMDTSGAVKAIVGGLDYNRSQYNRAVTARRQMGSAFKPIVYLAALERGLTPEHRIVDEPFSHEGWAPENATGEYYGQVTVREALSRSLNTIAARLAIQVGPQAVVDTAMKLGISNQLMAVPSIALGTQEVSLLELTAAYAPFASGGNGVIAHVITRITTAEGEELYNHIPAGPGKIVGDAEVAAMNDMLSYAVAAGTGRAAQLEDWPIAGKTGTSQENRDAVFVGYSARLITGVWIGNDDNTPMNNVGGGSFPAQIWSEYMKQAHRDLAPTPLPGQYGSGLEPGLPPAEIAEAEPPRERGRTIVDLIGDFFGG